MGNGIRRHASAVALLVGLLAFAPMATALAAPAGPRASLQDGVAVPRESVTLTGKLGKGRHRVTIQRKVGTKWRALTRVTSKRSGRYRAVVRLAGTSTLRAVVKRRHAGRLVSRPSRVTVLTRARWDGLQRACQQYVEWGPECQSVTNLNMRIGRVTVRDFHEAWIRGDRTTMRRLSVDDWYLAMFPGRGARTPLECEGAAFEGWLYCYAQARHGGWTGFRAELQSRVPAGGLPYWLITGAAPDLDFRS